MKLSKILLEIANTRSTDEIIKYVTLITPKDSDVPDYFFDIMKKADKEYELKNVKIKDVIKKDSGLKDYIKSGEVRYGVDGESDLTPNPEDIDLPIVIFNNQVIDGYSRLTTKYKNGKEYIEAWVSK
jgi:hypothetical protein